MPIDTLAPIQEEVTPQVSDVHLRTWIALLSIVSIASLSLEVEILEHLDSFSRFMTYREILFDSGVSLLGTIGVGFAWWLTVIVFLKLANLVTGVKRHSAALAWALWFGVPGTYLALDLVRAAEIEFSSEWSSKLSSWLMLGAILGTVCVFGIFSIEQSRLQRFCRTRLAPVGQLHLLAAVIALIAIFANGVYLFRNYTHPTRNVVASN